MCRSITTLRRPERTATDKEVSAAAFQFVRKVAGPGRHLGPTRRSQLGRRRDHIGVGQAARISETGSANETDGSWVRRKFWATSHACLVTDGARVKHALYAN